MKLPGLLDICGWMQEIPLAFITCQCWNNSPLFFQNYATFVQDYSVRFTPIVVKSANFKPQNLSDIIIFMQLLL
jgi:hypothetical protein